MKRRSLVLAAAVAVLALLYLFSASLLPYRSGALRPVDIPRGSTLGSIADSLAANDVLRDRYVFMLMARLSSSASRLQSGYYKFPESASAADILAILVAGSHQAAVRVTIREGLTIRRIAAVLAKEAGFDAEDVIALSRDRDFIDSLGLDVRQLEGYLLPDTYDIRFDATPRQVLARMAAAMRRQFTAEFLARMDERGLSVHQVLTMASLVEGETRLAEERARVAGVYYNRLRRGMLLQADPTVQYIIPDGPRRLLYSDLAINSPYNTYMYRGLPPGPVNNPGVGAIRAALWPEEHGFYYFVADGSGGHTFSRNYEEHLKAVAVYRKLQRRAADNSR
ncbi:MAG: endolytic transglycosylase MltG [Bacteroidia bacterium]|nr:endolytic transglycosylase MltG [Bacteroidia bacterium]